MALLSNIAGTEQVALTKINACITTVNLLGGGTVGKIATKSSANDFDIFYAENAFNQKSTTSLAIGTGNKDFDIGGSQWDDDFNFRVRAFSIASPGNYMEGTISALIAGYGVKTWRMVVDTVVGSGTFADWQFQVLSEQYATSYNDTSTTGTGDIVDSFTGSASVSITGIALNSFKIGNRVTIDGQISFVPSSTTPTVRLNLKTGFARSSINQGGGYYPMTVFNQTDTTIESGVIAQISSRISLVDRVPYISGKTYIAYFNLSYTVE
jgi:hypothetical protein